MSTTEKEPNHCEHFGVFLQICNVHMCAFIMWNWSSLFCVLFSLHIILWAFYFIKWSLKTFLITAWYFHPQPIFREHFPKWAGFASLLSFSSSCPPFPGGVSGKEPTCQCRRHKRLRFNPWIRKIPWRRAWQPTPVFLPGESPWTE